MERSLRNAIIATALLILGLILLFILGFKSIPTPPIEVEEPEPSYSILGESVEGRVIEAYRFGDGHKHLLLVGGIHGGYEWNTVVLAYRFIDYFDTNPEVIPEDLEVTIIPSLNPDGIYKVVGKEGRFVSTDIPESVDQALGRFNANEVDLNRNFDCKWQPESTWRSKVVSAGSAPFSEPESEILRDFVLDNDPLAVVFWHSQGDAVYASDCEDGILPDTLKIMDAYSDGSGYRAVESFSAYETTGDAEGWLAAIGIPSITVELKTHEAIEWERNLAGIKALFEHYSPENSI